MTEADPFLELQQLAGGYCVSRCLHVVADLGIADVLGETPRTAADLAGSVGADADALGRVLRLLSSHGVFASDGDLVSHTVKSRLLRSDHPQSLRAFARMFGLPINWLAYEGFEEAVRTGRPVADKAYPGGLWAYFGAYPDAARIFNDAMVEKAHAQVGAVVASRDFSSFQTIGDIGGGRGQLLRAVLERAPDSTGVLFDLPRVIAEAEPAPRTTLQAGDFFADPLPVCDAYLLMEIIHDWPDREATLILEAVTRAAPPGASVFVIEQLVPADPGPDWSKMLDIHMLTLLGGRQRTAAEYQALIETAGLEFVGETETGAGISVVEAKCRTR